MYRRGRTPTVQKMYLPLKGDGDPKRRLLPLLGGRRLAAQNPNVTTALAPNVRSLRQSKPSATCNRGPAGGLIAGTVSRGHQCPA